MMSPIAMGGGSSAVAASSHAACARFRGTDPADHQTESSATRSASSATPTRPARIPEARWMRAVVFERLVRDDRFASRVATTTVGRLRLPRPGFSRSSRCEARPLEDDRASSAGRSMLRPQANRATLIHAPAVAYPGFEDAGATDVLPDFVVIAPQTEAPERAWLVVGDAKDYERVRSRIDDARLLKGYLQVALAAEAFDQWSQRPGAAGRPPVRGSGRAEERVPAADGDGRRPQGPPRRGPHPPGRAS